MITLQDPSSALLSSLISLPGRERASSLATSDTNLIGPRLLLEVSGTRVTRADRTAACYDQDNMASFQNNRSTSDHQPMSSLRRLRSDSHIPALFCYFAFFSGISGLLICLKFVFWNSLHHSSFPTSALQCDMASAQVRLYPIHAPSIRGRASAVLAVSVLLIVAGSHHLRTHVLGLLRSLRRPDHIAFV